LSLKGPRIFCGAPKEELEEEVQLRTVDLRLANEQITGCPTKMTRDILQKAAFRLFM